MFLGDDLLTYLVLAFGAALLAGNALALVRPPSGPEGAPPSRPPLARTLTMMAIGFVATVWAVATLVT